ncbi:hypothetical protein CEV33_3807 [Brucella grignonensis]|uniref:Uncharacterized protein n=1 Tax=Brucella grignonensis TaxID=94627 RepID=A0A256FSE3_9HYPH|nr:hypothetical protein CEV33_3807 [Brucella grignonensis]
MHFFLFKLTSSRAMQLGHYEMNMPSCSSPQRCFCVVELPDF